MEIFRYLFAKDIFCQQLCIYSVFYIKRSVFTIRESLFTLKIGMYLFCILFFNSVLIIVGTGILYYLEYGVKGLPPRWY